MTEEPEDVLQTLDRLDRELDEDMEAMAKEILPCADRARHLVCIPYSIPNLHKMAAELGIKRCWFHRDHYDIPLRRKAEIEAKAMEVSSREVLDIIRGKWN